MMSYLSNAAELNSPFTCYGVSKHNTPVTVLHVQDPKQRPSINDVKDELLRFAHTHFQSRTPAEALALKHAKERALLDQILPPKVGDLTQEVCMQRKAAFQHLTEKTKQSVGA